MSLADAFYEVEVENINRVNRATWGHLHPKHRKKHKGYILFACTEYREAPVIKVNFKGVSDSPWFYQHIHEYAFRQCYELARKRSPGVYRFEGTYMVYNNGRPTFSGKVTKIKA